MVKPLEVHKLAILDVFQVVLCMGIPRLCFILLHSQLSSLTKLWHVKSVQRSDTLSKQGAKDTDI